MVRQIPNEMRRRVVKLWLDGNTYREISAKTGVSIGVISSIIKEERGRVPDIDELRELKLALIQADANPIDALRGAGFLEKLNDLNIPMTRIRACINLLNQYGEKGGEVLDSSLRLKELETSQGKTYEHILTDAAEKARELQILKKRIGELNGQEKTLRNSLLDLDHLKTLKDKMNRYGLTLSRLDGFIEQSIRLEELGFTAKAAELLASELTKIGLDPQKAATILAKLLSQYGSLEEAVAKLFTAKSTLQQDIETKKDQQESVTKQLETLKEQVDNFKRLTETEEKLYKYKKYQLEKEYTSKRDALETLHNERMRNLKNQYEFEKSKVNAEIRELEEQRKLKMKDVQELKGEDEVLRANMREAETALINIEEKIVETRPLAALVSLIKDSTSPIEKTALLKAVLGVVEGFKTQLNTKMLPVSNRLKLSGSLYEISRILAEELKLAA